MGHKSYMFPSVKVERLRLLRTGSVMNGITAYARDTKVRDVELL